MDGGAADCGATDDSMVVGIAAGDVVAGDKAADGSAASDSARNGRNVGKGLLGGNSITVAGTGADGRPEHRCARDAVAGGVGKGTAAGKAA